MKRAMLVMLALVSAQTVAAADFSVKGFELGKQAEEFYPFLDCEYKKDGLVTCKNRDASMTIGGEAVTVARVEFNEQKLSISVVLGFKSDSYSAIKSAIVTKYPKIKCRKSELVTKIGAHIPSETCTIGTKTEVLSVQAHAGTVDQGGLSILSAEALHGIMKADKIKQADI